ncbi:hypothetical protein Tco_1456174 [Tanacetum coccineum]
MEILPELTSNMLCAGNPVKEILLKLNLPDHRSKLRCSNHIPEESDSLPHAHTQATKTYYKHQDSRIKKAKAFKMMHSMSMLVKTQDRKMAMTITTNKDKDLKISESKTKSKDNDKGSRSKITQHEGTSLQQDKVKDQDSRAQR